MPALSQLEKVRRYYDETRFDYNVAWFSRDHLALHFGFYDENAFEHETAVPNTNRFLADAAQIEVGERVLDAGCGRGGSAFWLVKNRGVIVVGITPVGSQVKEAKQLAATGGMTEVASFFEKNYLETGFPEASFDVVWACESHCHTDQKPLFFKEAFRLLRPGGRLVIADCMRFRRGLPDEQELFLRKAFHGWAVPDIDTGQEHFEHATAAGFGEIIIRDCSKYVRVSFRNVFKHCRRWLWLGYILRGLGVRSKVEHENLVGTYNICKAFHRGLCFYGVLTALKRT